MSLVMMNRCIWLQLNQIIRAESIPRQLVKETKGRRGCNCYIDATKKSVTPICEKLLFCLDLLLRSTVQSSSREVSLMLCFGAVRCRDDLVTLAAAMCHGLPWLRKTGHLCNLCRVCPDCHDWSQNWNHESKGNLISQLLRTDEDLVQGFDPFARDFSKTFKKQKSCSPIFPRVFLCLPGLPSYFPNTIQSVSFSSQVCGVCWVRSLAASWLVCFGDLFWSSGSQKHIVWRIPPAVDLCISLLRQMVLKNLWQV